MTDVDDAFGLANVLVALRHELNESQRRAQEENIKFGIDEIDIELEVVTLKSAEAKCGVKFWVYNAEGGGKLASESRHKLRLKLRPEGPGGEPLKVAGEVTRRPEARQRTRDGED